MQTEIFKVANLMCSGCANTIKNELIKSSGIKSIEVDLENKTVTLTYEHLERNYIVNLLSSIGFPESTV